MPRQPATVTGTELAILDVLWDEGESTVRRIAARLYQENSPSTHATVKSLLDRLIGKGYVQCDRSGFAHVFRAEVDRDTLVGQQLQQIADSHFSGSLGPMLLNLVDRVTLSDQEREAIRKIIEKGSE